jgi:chlorobactene lauroyltransferase
MITARKAAWFETTFDLYNRSLLWRRFKSLNINGLEYLQERDKTVPLVLYANHSSWFDPLVAYRISRLAKLDAYAMMEEKNLRKLMFFRKIGAFSVVRENPRKAVKSINYIVEEIKAKPNRAVWIFPQGEIQPNDIRPLELFHGLARIVEKTGRCYAAPVAMRFEFLEDFKPEIFADIGQLELFENVKDSKQLTGHFTKRLTDLLDNLKEKITYQS